MNHFDMEGGGRMPALGLGTWKSDPGIVGDTMREAIRIGYRHFDCAPIYGNEAEIGRAFEGAMSAGEVSRGDLWVTSKLWNFHHLRPDVVPGLKKTLSDLRLDHLDLYLVHWPVAHRPGVVFPEDPKDFLSLDEAPLAETWAGMEDALNAGLCRHIGVSNFSIRKISDLLDHAAVRPSANQVECHPYFPQTDLLRFCKQQNIVLTAYSPLGSGDRPARIKRENEPVMLQDPVVLDVAARHELTPGQVLLAWALQRGTSVIPKSSDPGRLRENFAAAQVELDPEDMASIDALDRSYRFVDGSFWCPDGSPYTLETLWDE
ncbi:MAG: aldehyde oxidoreductase [Gammaproteobacteria bacterium SG8_31]|jgi:alcohol dehydrogenase (NADP+)|nr:MAG: aldehyde oxidoreductase [Gammaproteobacteria bacterium SG8_31]